MDVLGGESGKRSIQSVCRVNGGLIALCAVEEAEGAVGEPNPIICGVPGGGRVFIAIPSIVAAVKELLGPGAELKNPYEVRLRKEFLRRAKRILASIQ